MKRKLSIVLAIALTLILSLSSVAFAAGDKVTEEEVDVAQDAGQAWLDRIAALTGEPSEWIGAHLTAPQVYYDLKGQPNAYMFAMENDGMVVGHIIVGSSAYGYPVFQAGESAPPSIPTADEVKSSIERDLGLKIAKESIGEPSCLLYLGIDKLYAIYEVEGQTIGVNLISERATLASNLKSYMPSPEEYKAAKKEAKGSKPLSLRSSGYYWLVMEYYREGERKWCGPCSGVSIGRYYRTEHEPSYDDLPSPDSYMYDWLRFEMGVPTTPGNYGPAFIAMTEDCSGHYDNFSYVNNYHLEDSDYWTVVDDIDSSWPLGLEITDEWHWRAIKGYSYNTDTDRYEVICTNSATPSDWERIDWLLLGWWDFTCCIKD